MSTCDDDAGMTLVPKQLTSLTLSTTPQIIQHSHLCHSADYQSASWNNQSDSILSICGASWASLSPYLAWSWGKILALVSRKVLEQFFLHQWYTTACRRPSMTWMWYIWQNRASF